MSTSPQKWTPETKRFVFVICVILIGLAVYNFSVVLAPIVVAVIIAYLLSPLTDWFTQRTPFDRKVAAAIVYITFLLVLMLIPTILAPVFVQQVRQIDIDLMGITTQLDDVSQRAVTELGDLIDLPINAEDLTEPVAGSFSQVLSYVAASTATIVVGIAGGVIWAILIIVVGYYILVDAHRFTAWVDSWVPGAYHDEFIQLRKALDGVWKSYFIGQLTLAVIVGFTIGIATAILGIRSALLLGLIAALLELIPNWGYGLSGAIGILFALFQGSTWIPLPNWAFALIVAGFYFIMWQIDTNYLVPRIIGNRLQLSPAIIIVGIIAGASVGGALGLLLAAPTIASVRVLGSYIYRRLLDIQPYVVVFENLPPDDDNANKTDLELQPDQTQAESI